MPKIVAPILVLALGIVGAMTLVRSRAEVQAPAPQATVPLVRVVTVRVSELPQTVSAHGTVVPRTEATLASQVAGVVAAVSPDFEVGGFFERGDVLLSLDARDYRLAVDAAAAKVAQAELRLVQQRAEARVAGDEWRQLGDGEPDPLVLREPQLAEARAALKAAEAELGMARLDLERTRIRAPFDGRLRAKSADLGQYLMPGNEVATVHAVDYAEVRLPIPDRELAFLDLPIGFHADAGAGELDGTLAATLSAEFGGRRHHWPGRVVRADGELDASSRMLNLVVRVEDPYGRSRSGRPPLAVGLFVDAEIAGRSVLGALVPRAALRADERVLVVDDDDRLRWRDVVVARSERDSVLITDGLRDGEQVCVSPLDVVVDGMQVRTVEIEAPAAPETPAMPDPPDPSDPSDPSDLSHASDLPPDAGALIAAAPTGRLLDVSLLAGGQDTTVIAARIDGDFEVATSRLEAPERFVVDLLGVARADARAEIELAEGPVARVRTGQYQSVPEPITRLVFDLTAAGGEDPALERTEAGLTITF